VARKRASLDPPNTQPLTPAQVAALYNFPPGNGSSQTIGLYEMATPEPHTGQLVPAGYATSDIAATMAALGNLPVPNIIEVPVDGTGNSGVSDGETGLDITVAGALAPIATIAAYFAGAETQQMLFEILARAFLPPPRPVEPPAIRRRRRSGRISTLSSGLTAAVPAARPLAENLVAAIRYRSGVLQLDEPPARML
jgi:hypothetical protein